MIAAIGISSVLATSKPGLEIGLSDEKSVSTMAMQDPAPMNAASVDTPATSFKRIDSIPQSSLSAACEAADL